MKIALLYSSETQKGIIRGLENLGHSIIPYYYGLKRKIHIMGRILGVLKGRERAIVNSFNKRLADIHECHLKNSFDMILIIKGHNIDSYSKKILLRKDIIKIQWTIDSVERWPGQAKLFPYMDKVFFQDGSDVKLHGKGEWLPLGFDDTLFKYNANKTIDILLLGNIIQPLYSNRRECFMQLASLAKKGYKVSFAGNTKDKDFIKVLKSCGVEVLGRQSLINYAELISKAKICVNIHQNDGIKAINPVFFAIPSTGGIELSDDYDYLKEWLVPYRHYFPTSAATISEDIMPLLTLKPLAENIAREVTNRHSYNARARTILKNSDLSCVS